MSELVCYKCRVYGRVQGVFFRASTRDRATALGLTGYARNLPDGSVEVLGCGEAGRVAALRDWLWRGPAHARVERVACEQVPDQEPPADFTTA